MKFHTHVRFNGSKYIELNETVSSVSETKIKRVRCLDAINKRGKKRRITTTTIKTTGKMRMKIAKNWNMNQMNLSIYLWTNTRLTSLIERWILWFFSFSLVWLVFIFVVAFCSTEKRRARKIRNKCEHHSIEFNYNRKRTQNRHHVEQEQFAFEYDVRRVWHADSDESKWRGLFLN